MLPPTLNLPINGDFKSLIQLNGLEKPARKKVENVEIEERKRVEVKEMKQNEWGELRL